MSAAQEIPTYGSKWAALSRKRLAIAKAQGEPCALCGKAIDYTLHGNARMGATTDHALALAHGGDMLPPLDELRPAHRLCQSKQGARIGNAMKKGQRSRQADPVLRQPLPHPASLSIPYSQVGIGDRPAWLPEEFHEAPSWSCFPRIEVGFHPGGVGSHAQAVIDWVESNMGIRLRWWQKYVLWRLLEHDENGSLIWSEAAVSTARQSGKSWLLRSLAMGRIHHPHLFGMEAQTVMHVANIVGVVTEVAFPALAWAQNKGGGYYIRRTNGEIEVRTPAGGRYLPRSSSGGYGFSANMALVDECWDLKPVVVDTMISPTMLERTMPQLALFSTAHPLPTPLFPAFRGSGSVDDRRLVIEWSADPDDDLHDEAAWRKASPEWSVQRQTMLGRLVNRISKEDFATQHLNIWPATAREHPTPFPRWPSAPACIGNPPADAVVAIDQTHDADRVAIAAMANGCVWYRQAQTLREAAAVVNGWGSQEVIVGISLRNAALALSLPVRDAYGARESAQGLPLLVRGVALGEVAHEHQPVLDQQFAGAVLKVSDGGTTSLSVKDSQHRVIGPKLISWLLLHAQNDVGESPAVW